MRTVLLTLLAIGLLYSAYLLFLYSAQQAMIYPGQRLPVPPEPPDVPNLQRVQLDLPFGRVDAFFLPPLSRTEPPWPVVISAHGNGEVADPWVTELDGFRQLGVAVMIVEYPGYARSRGAPSEATIGATLTSAYDWLAANPRVDSTGIVGFGQSLGGGAICLLSRQRPLRALILVSTFTSFKPLAHRFGAPAFLLRDRFDNLAAVKVFKGPVLIIHGRSDTVIPVRHAEALAQAAQDPTLRIHDCDHPCWYPDRLPFWQEATQLLVDARVINPQHGT